MSFTVETQRVKNNHQKWSIRFLLSHEGFWGALRKYVWILNKTRPQFWMLRGEVKQVVVVAWPVRLQLANNNVSRLSWKFRRNPPLVAFDGARKMLASANCWHIDVIRSARRKQVEIAICIKCLFSLFSGCCDIVIHWRLVSWYDKMIVEFSLINFLTNLTLGQEVAHRSGLETIYFRYHFHVHWNLLERFIVNIGFRLVWASWQESFVIHVAVVGGSLIIQSWKV